MVVTVDMDKEYDQSFLIRIATGDYTADEHATFINWFQNATPEERRQVIETFEAGLGRQDKAVPAMPAAARQQIKAVLDAHIAASIKSTPSVSWVPSRSHSRKVFLRYAAALLVVMCGAWFAYTRFTAEAPWLEHTTAHGEQIKFQLDDGSSIWLNAGSILKYPAHFTGRTREVFLQGEAFFHVARNEQKPFIVHTKVLDTKVLGTSFNIKAFQGTEERVSVVTGKVKVTTNDEKHAVTLLPQEETVLDTLSGLLLKTATTRTEALDWKDGVLFLDGKLSDMIPLIERWYNVKIDLQTAALKDCIIQAKFRHETLQNVLESMQYFLGIEYSIQNRVVQINGKGCSLN